MRILQRAATLCFAATLSLSCVAQHKSPLAIYIKEDAPVLMLDHVRVIDGTGAAPQEDMRILIAGGKITALQDAKSHGDYPSNAKVLDMTGKTVMPGLVGMHEHLFYPLPDRPADGLALYAEAADSAPRLYLAGGVTTARTGGSLEPYTDLELKRAIEAGKIPGPKLDITGPYLEGKGTFAIQMIADLVAHHVAITSTLAIFETMAGNRPPMERESAALKTLNVEAAREYLTVRASRAEQQLGQTLLQKEMLFEHEFVAAGGLLMAGCDPTGYGGVVPGYGDQRNLELLVEAGFTPVEAIRIASLNGAKYMGKDAEIGSIAPGKAADIVVLGGNPADKIENVEKVEMVFKDGVGYDSAALIQSVKGTVGIR